jgi:RNA polymerase sigma factor (sigma-70 family)
MALIEQKSVEILALDQALSQLAKIDERKARVVEFKYFGGMLNEEIAEVLQISEMTVVRDWNMAKAWLANKLGGK